jgi:hypothetical protein
VVRSTTHGLVHMSTPLVHGMRQHSGMAVGFSSQESGLRAFERLEKSKVIDIAHRRHVGECYKGRILLAPKHSRRRTELAWARVGQRKLL